MPLLLLLGGLGGGFVLGTKTTDILKYIIIGGVAYLIITKSRG